MNIEGPKVEVPEAFVYYVRRTRRLQQAYFKDRNPLTLQECKSAERSVDFYLRNIEAGQEADETQKALF